MGTSLDPERWQRVMLTSVVAVFAVTAAVTYGLIGQLRAADQRVSYEHAERVIEADAIQIALFARSSSLRGYLLSGDDLFLESRQLARLELGTRIANLRRRSVKVHALDDIETLIGRLDAGSDRAVARFATSRDEARALWEAEARPVQDQLAARVGELVRDERDAFASVRSQAAAASRASARSLAAVLGGVAMLLVLLVYGYARATRALVARYKAEQEQTTFRLLEQVPVGIFVLTAGGAPYYANQHAKRLLGRGVVPTPLEKLAETYAACEAGTGRTYPADRLPIVRALAGHTAECTDMEIRRGDEVIPLHVVAAPVHDARGALLYAVAGFQDVRELQLVAMRDALTGLMNRAAVTQVYARERAVSARAKRSLSVALIDFDRFKLINDTHGHAVGDEVLKRVAAALVTSLRRSDAIGRWGGEELVVLLPGTDALGARHAIEKTLADVRSLSFAGKAGVAFSVTFSAGAVLTAPSESLDEAIARADILLYEAKRAGRNRVNIGNAG